MHPLTTPHSSTSPVRRHRLRTRATGLVLLLGLLSTGCDFFAEVPQPGWDPTPPEGIVAVWYDDVYHEVEWGTIADPYAQFPAQFEHELANPHQTVWALGAGMDDGGVSSLHMTMHIFATCSAYGFDQYVNYVGSEFGHKYAPDPFAAPGEMVPDGLWTGLAFRPSLHFNACGSDQLIRVEARWYVHAENFSFYDTYFGLGVMYYEP